MSRWDFYDTINLKKYLPKKPVGDSTLTCDTTENCEYQLHSVLVHSGSDARFGHYYCFVRVGKKWYKFNDENVSEGSAYDTFGCNFGGNTINYWGAKVPKICNGYMLVYIRKSELERVLTPCTEADHPETLKAWIEEQRAEEERKRQEKLEEHLYVRMFCMGSKDVQSDPKRLLLPCVSQRMLDEMTPLRHKMDCTLESVADEIEAMTGIPPERQQYWGVDFRGMSYRMQKPLPASTTFQNCCLRQDYRSSHECVVYVHDTDLPYFGTKRKDADVMITHHKLYDPATSSLVYLGSVPVGGGVATHTSNLEPKVRELAALAIEQQNEGTDFFTQLEDGDELECLLEPEDTAVLPSPTTPASGDIFIWQRVLSQAEAEICAYPTIQDYKHFQLHKVVFNVLLNHPPNYPKQFELTMAYDVSYEQVQKRIALELQKKLSSESPGLVATTSQQGSSSDVTTPAPEDASNIKSVEETPAGSPTTTAGAAVVSCSASPTTKQQTHAKLGGGGEVDWRHILLASWNPDTRSPYFAKPKKREKHTLRTLLTPLKGTSMVDTLYFEVHQHAVEDLESSNPLHFEYFNEHVKPEGSACVLFPLPPKLYVRDVLEKCAAAMDLPEDHPPLRLVDIWRGRLYTIYDRPDEEFTTAFEERAEYHIEVQPEKLKNVPESEQGLIQVGHVTKQTPQNGGSNNNGNGGGGARYNYHGDPFSLWISADDYADDVMDRVALKLDIARQAIADWKPLLTQTAFGFELDLTKPVLQQYRALFRDKPDESGLNFYFALEHAPMVGGRRGNRRVDQILRINN